MTTPQQAPNADDFLMGGGGAPTGKFPVPGTTIAGHVTQKPTVEQQRDIKDNKLKFWSDGNPMMQLVVTVQTDQRDPSIEDDDGKRRLYVKGAMKNAISEAVRTAGARGLEVGGHLTVTYTHELPPKGPGMSPPKQYAAQYVPAAANALHTPEPTAAQQYAAPPVAAASQAYAPPAAAPYNPAQAALAAQQQVQQTTVGADTPPF